MEGTIYLLAYSKYDTFAAQPAQCFKGAERALAERPKESSHRLSWLLFTQTALALGVN